MKIRGNNRTLIRHASVGREAKKNKHSGEGQYKPRQSPGHVNGDVKAIYMFVNKTRIWTGQFFPHVFPIYLNKQERVKKRNPVLTVTNVLG